MGKEKRGKGDKKFTKESAEEKKKVKGCMEKHDITRRKIVFGEREQSSTVGGERKRERIEGKGGKKCITG